MPPVLLALGVGATTAVFSVLEGVVLRPLPFPEPDRLAVVWQNDRATGTVRENASTSDYYDYLERNRSFGDLAIFGLGTAVLAREGAPPIQLNAASVSRNLLDVLGLELQAGRNFTADEDAPGGPRAVLLTDRVWRDLYGADPTVVGRTILIDDTPHVAAGVLPAGTSADPRMMSRPSMFPTKFRARSAVSRRCASTLSSSPFSGSSPMLRRPMRGFATPMRSWA